MKGWWVIFNDADDAQHWWLVVANTRRGAIRVARRRMAVRLSLDDVLEIKAGTAMFAWATSRPEPSK